MNNRILLVIVVFVASYVDGRVYYLENLNGIRENDAINPSVDEPFSRDLDLSFSAGEPIEHENIAAPTKKVYALIQPEKSYIELNRNMERPFDYYRLREPAVTRRGDFDDVVVIPVKDRKLTKFNGNGKGEVILELRVIANHDNE